MNKLAIALTLTTVALSNLVAFSAYAEKQTAKLVDKMSVNQFTLKNAHKIIIVKWKDSSIHSNLTMVPELELKSSPKYMAKSISRSSLNLPEVLNRDLGLESIEQVYSKTGIQLKHLRTMSLNNDVFMAKTSLSEEQLIDKLMSTGQFALVNINKKIEVNSATSKPLQKRVTNTSLDKNAFNDPAYLLSLYLDEQVEGLMGAHSFLKAGDFAKENNNLGRKVRIGIIDTGFWEHADVDYSADEGYDFVSNFDFRGYGDCTSSDSTKSGDDATCSQENFVEDTRDSDPTDKSWFFPYDSNGNVTGDGSVCVQGHGLSVASTIATVRNNSKGVVGAIDSNDVTLIPIRTLGCDGGWASDSADAIVWASGGAVPGVENINEPVDIINLSLGGGGICNQNSEYFDAVEFAISQGVVVVASAGNGNIDMTDFAPASCEGVLAVGSNTILGEKSLFSNYGEDLDVTFFGNDVNVAYVNTGIYINPENSSFCNLDEGTPSNDSCYSSVSGTSFSAPLASAALAMMKMVHSGMSESELRALVSLSAGKYDFNRLGNQTIRSSLMPNAGNGNVVNALNMDLDLSTVENIKAEHNFKNFEGATDELYLSSLSNIASKEAVCATYSFTWGNYKSPIDSVEYFLFGSNSSDEVMDFNNSSLLSSGVEATDMTFNIIDFNRVGIVSYVNGQAGEIFEVDLSRASRPTFCI
ncbi:S8 family serine peptidase [Brumicola nitratireducens]|uniref:Peptidase S8 and S53, subtilisin, kexin, sedolisin n=1 Tax=Glaciecola nitratireducens (strain JCM 12485 / KCTC 12276 / FR1064) TaxID=1085623 RepID=G4QN55_GLANF|nr:S8 family serine peptidase [Glaciecola nitratireducens]AEP31474.1 peptidase S8 and S53, subtilisin, kexin, sedolisin [Glaciecola nitratireducens FR1064]